MSHYSDLYTEDERKANEFTKVAALQVIDKKTFLEDADSLEFIAENIEYFLLQAKLLRVNK